MLENHLENCCLSGNQVGNLAEGEGDRRQQKGAAKVRELHGQQLYLESWNILDP